MLSPSTAAASSSSVGRLSKNAFITSRLNTLIAFGRTIAHIVLRRPSELTST